MELISMSHRLHQLLCGEYYSYKDREDPPSNKPRITSDLKMLLNIKKKALQEGDRGLFKTAHKQLKKKIRESK